MMARTSSDVQSNLTAIRARMSVAARRVGRDPADVRLVAVTKSVDCDRIREVLAGGVLDLGENRVQEAEKKVAALGQSIRWHLVGHLQSNKARRAVYLFDLIHSVDSEALAVELSRRAEVAGRRVGCLLQVNVAREPTKFGVEPEQAPVLGRRVAALPGLRLTGLMTIAPLAADPEASRPVFRRLRELSAEIGAELGWERPELSMGMSQDFEVAIEEGATLVRVGSLLFGPRA